MSISKQCEIDISNAINLCCLHNFIWRVPTWVVNNIEEFNREGISVTNMNALIEFIHLRYPQYIFKSVIDDVYLTTPSTTFSITKSNLNDGELCRVLYI